MRFFLPVLSLLILMSCTIPVRKDELRSSPAVSVKGLILNKNYQALLKCWDEKAEKETIVNETRSEIYQDLGMAEIQVGGIEGKYSVIIDLKKLSKDRTEINAYGTGAIGKGRIPEWTDLLKKCAE